MPSHDPHTLRERLVGTWKLVSSEFRRGDGTVIYPLGEQAQGLLIYDDLGHVSAQLMRPDRPEFAAGNPLLGTPEEIKAGFEGFMSYYGTYEVDAEGGLVTHHMEGSLFPNHVGKRQKRFFTFEGDRLLLRTPPMKMPEGEMVGLLIWERAR